MCGGHFLPPTHHHHHHNFVKVTAQKRFGNGRQSCAGWNANKGTKLTKIRCGKCFQPNLWAKRRLWTCTTAPTRNQHKTLILFDYETKARKSLTCWQHTHSLFMIKKRRTDSKAKLIKSIASKNQEHKGFKNVSIIKLTLHIHRILFVKNLYVYERKITLHCIVYRKGCPSKGWG